MDLPANLIEQVSQQRVILFLGAGASLDAADSLGNRPPTTGGLTQMLSRKFLGGQFDKHTLSEVAEYSASESNLLSVQEYIKETFAKFEPSEAHKLMTRFSWAGLATTNYDLLVEKAYGSEAGALQTPVSFIENGDQIIERLRDPKSVKYIKLHGCITRITNANCPLILSLDQYNQYQKGRDRLFDQLREWAYEHVIIFIGHGGQDADIRKVIFDIEAVASCRQRFFAVLPGKSAVETRYWETKRVTILDGTFLDFLKCLDGKLIGTLRAFASPPSSAHPICHRFRVAGATISKNCLEFLGTEAFYVKGYNPKERISPIDFYRGYTTGWSGVEQSFDVRRDFSDDLISDCILIDDLQAQKSLEVVLVKGYAGSGKTTALRRIAWDSAHEYDRLCLFLDDSAHINIGAIQEIIELCRERVFLFIDNAQERVGDLRNLVAEIGEQGKLLTVILAARSNEWNGVPGDVQNIITDQYDVRPLSKKEIINLLEKLKLHGALDRLADKTLDEQIDAFDNIAGRQLLVALHEATLGVPFEEIIESEYQKIHPVEAQQVYLTICILNRLGVPVRAGVISRIHNVPFEAFKDRLFKPLEHVVYAEYDKRIRDNVYRARHRIIADIVFERILRQQDRRFEEYFRTFSALNVDYSTDAEAFRHMIKGRNLIKLFPNHEYCEDIYDKSYQMIGDEPNLLQQRAIYEMNRANGNLDKASRLISRAIDIIPSNKGFKHTKAELALRKADAARTSLEREKLLREASALAHETKDGRSGENHSHHTLAKVQMKRLEIAIEENGSDFSSPVLQGIIKTIEVEIWQGLQNKPGDSYMLTEQAKLAELLNDSPRLIESLEKAFVHNPKLGYLAVRLSNCLNLAGKREDAKRILEQAIEANSSDHLLNYRYALFLTDEGASEQNIAYYLRRSFSPGDQNFDAQLRYCRSLFVIGEFESLRKEISLLRAAKYAPFVRDDNLYYAPLSVDGIVKSIRYSHIIAVASISQLHVLVPRGHAKPETWALLTEGSRIRFRVGFSFRGLVGVDCEIA